MNEPLNPVVLFDVAALQVRMNALEVMMGELLLDYADLERKYTEIIGILGTIPKFPIIDTQNSNLFPKFPNVQSF